MYFANKLNGKFRAPIRKDIYLSLSTKKETRRASYRQKIVVLEYTKWFRKWNKHRKPENKHPQPVSPSREKAIKTFCSLNRDWETIQSRPSLHEGDDSDIIEKQIAELELFSRKLSAAKKDLPGLSKDGV